MKGIVMLMVLCAGAAAHGDSAQRARSAPTFTLSPNRPYATEAGKLHFHHPISVQTGSAASFENRAEFDALTQAQNSRYVRLGLKTTAGAKYKISCSVTGAGKGTFEVVGPNLVLKPPLTATTLAFEHQAQIAHWAWFTIAATAPWTFHQCSVSKG